MRPQEILQNWRKHMYIEFFDKQDKKGWEANELFYSLSEPT